MKITINDDLQTLLPQFHVLAYDLKATPKDINRYQLLNSIETDATLDSVTSVTNIKLARDAYKRLGKDPSHTRVASEALLRRVIKKVAIEAINPFVDLGNLLSIQTNCSVCVVDYNKLSGDVLIRIGLDGEYVDAIGRYPINAQNLIVYCDEEGIFGSPTSDAKRTMVTEATKRVLVMIICFSNHNQDDVYIKQFMNDCETLLNIQELKKVL